VGEGLTRAVAGFSSFYYIESFLRKGGEDFKG